MTGLREDIDNAVEYHSVGGREWLVSDKVVAAARGFLALTETGQRVEWCETHERTIPPEMLAGNHGRHHARTEGCSIVPAYVVPTDYLADQPGGDK